ncbi:MAG: glycosyltransferase family 4 protein [Bacteroidales bacterium]|nr:glycosyltransferase family 4 protein [Bacteroidales bacterium]
MGNKILICGTSTIHTYNYYELIRDSFSEAVIVSDKINPNYQAIQPEVFNFSLRNPMIIWQSIRKIKRFILLFKPDIIHIQQLGTHAWLLLHAAKRLNIPVIATAWGSDVLINPEKSYWHKKMLFYILNHATAFTADSLFVAARMKQIAKKDISVLVANFGINTLPMDLEKENIVYSNRAHKPLYRIDKVVKAFARFSRNNAASDWKLVIAGEGEETKALHNLAQKEGVADRIEFAGWIGKEKNSEYYHRSKIFVSIPESDATSISLLEAMDAGCIPVVSNLPANTEWVLNGINGLVVSNLSDDILSESLKLDAERAVKINQELIKTKGSREANHALFAGLYHQILTKA